MSKFPEKRLRFSVEQDIQLLMEIIRINPFEDPDRWTEVHENFLNDCNVPFSLRTCKDHTIHLVNLYLKDALKMRPRETAEDFAQKKKCLKKIGELREKFSAENSSRRGPKTSSTSWEESSTDPTVKSETRFIKLEGNDGIKNDFFWAEENERDKREKLREAADADGKLRKLELALRERKLALREQKLKLEKDRLELDQLERNKRLEIEQAEREAYKKVALQNQAIITALMQGFNGRHNGSSTNNLCVL